MFLPLSVELESRSKPIANLLIIGISCFVYWQCAEGVDADGALSPWVLPRLEAFEPQQLLGSIFMHFSIPHLLGNMLLVFVIGNPVNRRLGTLRYVALYLTLGAAAGLAWRAFGSVGVYSAGASGAAMGMVGMFLILFPTNRIKGLLLWTAVLELPVVGAWLVVFQAWGPGLFVAVFVVHAMGCVFLVTTSLAAGRDSALSEVALTVIGFRTLHVTGIWLVLMTAGVDVLFLLIDFSDVYVPVGYEAHLGGLFAGIGIGGVLALLGFFRGTEKEPTLVELVGLRAPMPVRATPRCRIRSRPLTYEEWAALRR